MFSFLNKKLWPNLSDADIKKRARILVIDDLDFPYRKRRNIA